MMCCVDVFCVLCSHVLCIVFTCKLAVMYASIHIEKLNCTFMNCVTLIRNDFILFSWHI